MTLPMNQHLSNAASAMDPMRRQYHQHHHGNPYQQQPPPCFFRRPSFVTTHHLNMQQQLHNGHHGYGGNTLPFTPRAPRLMTMAPTNFRALTTTPGASRVTPVPSPTQLSTTSSSSGSPIVCPTEASASEALLALSSCPSTAQKPKVEHAAEAAAAKAVAAANNKKNSKKRKEDNSDDDTREKSAKQARCDESEVPPLVVCAPTNTSTTSSPTSVDTNTGCPSSTSATSGSSCICPVCHYEIQGLARAAGSSSSQGEIDWSQVIQGRNMAKAIVIIKKHVKEYHQNTEPLWNVIVNSLNSTGSNGNSTASSTSSEDRKVTSRSFVYQALKKASLDPIVHNSTNSNGSSSTAAAAAAEIREQRLRSLAWTEKIMDLRIGMARGFIQFGGQEFLRQKVCVADDEETKISPKQLRQLAHDLLQTHYEDWMMAVQRNAAALERELATLPMGMLQNRFQLLFAAPDQWYQSWYMDPAAYQPRVFAAAHRRRSSMGSVASGMSV